MESIQNTLQKINLGQLQKTSETIQTFSDEISIYQGGQLTENNIIAQTEKILIAFPKIEPQMIKLLRERFKANNFSDERVKDAVNFVIDNYTGFDKLPAIADFVKFDKRVKVFTGTELRDKYKNSYYHGATYDPIANEYELIDFHGQPRYAKKEEVILYNLEKWNSN